MPPDGCCTTTLNFPFPAGMRASPLVVDWAGLLAATPKHTSTHRARRGPLGGLRLGPPTPPPPPMGGGDSFPEKAGPCVRRFAVREGKRRAGSGGVAAVAKGNLRRGV